MSDRLIKAGYTSTCQSKYPLEVTDRKMMCLKSRQNFSLACISMNWMKIAYIYFNMVQVVSLSLHIVRQCHLKNNQLLGPGIVAK